MKPKKCPFNHRRHEESYLCSCGVTIPAKKGVSLKAPKGITLDRFLDTLKTDRELPCFDQEDDEDIFDPDFDWFDNFEFGDN